MTPGTDPTTVEQLLRRLVPNDVGVAACLADLSLVEQLADDERALVSSARSGRRGEFAAGRSCAHRALAAIGADVVAIARGEHRDPLWPRGVTGSISHAGGLAAAVATWTAPTIAGIGIDLEVAHGLAPELWTHVLTPGERARCDADDDPVGAATTVFTAKEAAFKALYPLLGAEIDFLDATAEIGDHAGTVDVPGAGVSAVVRHGRAGGLVVSVAVVADRCSTARARSAAGR